MVYVADQKNGGANEKDGRGSGVQLMARGGKK